MNLIDFHIKYDFFVEVMPNANNGCIIKYPPNILLKEAETKLYFTFADNIISIENKLLNLNKQVWCPNYAQRTLVVADTIIKTFFTKGIDLQLIVPHNGKAKFTKDKIYNVIINPLSEDNKIKEKNMIMVLQYIINGVINNNILAFIDKQNIKEGYDLMKNLISNGGIII